MPKAKDTNLPDNFAPIFDPDDYKGLSISKEVITTALPGDEPFVQDLRGSNDGGLSIVPRLNTWDDLTSWANITIDRSKGWDAAPNGALVWRCIGIYLRSGAATFIPKFQLENGSPAGDILVVHFWPGSPSLPNPGSILPDYTGGRGVAGFTNANGDIGCGYSGEMVYTGARPFQGVGVIWPLCPTHLPEPKFADCVKGLGWFGGTDHTTPAPIFRLVRKASSPVPIPTGTKFTLALHQDGVDLGVRLALVGQPTGAGWELVLLDDGGQVVGSSRFVSP